MSVSYTYTSLRANLQRWLEDDFSDFVTQLDDIIGRAELRCLRDLDLELFDSTDTSKTTVGGNSTMALVDDAIKLRTLYVNDVFIEPRSESYVTYYSSIASQGQPLFFCISVDITRNANAIRLAPTPDAAYSTSQRVMKRPPGLSSTTDETWLSKNAGDLLFAACVAQSEWFDKAPEDLATAEAEYQKILAMARVELRQVMRRDYS